MVYSKICMGNIGIFLYLLITNIFYFIIILGDICICQWIIKHFFQLTLFDYYCLYKKYIVSIFIFIFYLISIFIRTYTLQKYFNIIKLITLVAFIVYITVDLFYIISNDLTLEILRLSFPRFFFGNKINAGNIIKCYFNLLQSFCVQHNVIYIYSIMKKKEKRNFN